MNPMRRAITTMGNTNSTHVAKNHSLADIILAPCVEEGEATIFYVLTQGCVLMTHGDACACVRKVDAAAALREGCMLLCSWVCPPLYASFLLSSSSSDASFNLLLLLLALRALHLFCSLCSSPLCSILSPLTSTLLSSRHALTC